MTFDEIFQQYIAQGFTKPVSGVSGIETLAPATIPIAPIPVIEPRGGENDINTNTIDTTNNAGINSFSDLSGINSFSGGIQSLVDLYNQLPTPINLAIKGLQNFQNPYTNIMGNLNQQTQAAITREEARDLQGRIDRGDFGSNTLTPQDKGRTDKGGNGGGSSDGSKGSRGEGMGGFGGGADRG